MQLRLCFLEGLILVIFIVVTTIIARWGNAVGVPTEQNYPTNRENFLLLRHVLKHSNLGNSKKIINQKF